MADDSQNVNEIDYATFLEFQKRFGKEKKESPKIISSLVEGDRELAVQYHENFGVVFRGENKVYPVKRYKNGTYGFFYLTPDYLAHREILLRKHFPAFYAHKELTKAQRQERMERKLRISYGTFQPREAFISSTGEINRYVPPYWYQVKTGMISPPQTRETTPGELTELQDRFFMHLLLTERDRHIVWKFGKESMSQRLNKALLLMGTSGTGKSALIAMFMGLHYPNCNNSYNVKQFFTKQFAWGALAETTLTGINEGTIEKDYLQAFKIFMSNDTFDAERKFIQNAGVRNYNNLMISTDLSECLNSADQATLNRLIIPQLTDIPLIGAESYRMNGEKASPFTEEEVKRIYNMATFTNKEQAEKDTLALAEFLQKFDNKSINLHSKEISGFQNKLVACENFYNGLANWKRRFILEVLYPYLKTQTPQEGVYKVDLSNIEKARRKAAKLPDIRSDLKEDNRRPNIAMSALFDLGRIDGSIFYSVEPNSDRKLNFWYRISKDFVDVFLTSIAETSDQKET